MIMQWRKWDGSVHWRHECVYLGSDEWGDWLGQPVGWNSRRPGVTVDAERPHLTLVPPCGDYALTVNRDHPRGLRVYIDVAWDVHWGSAAGDDRAAEDLPIITGIDMDLDVVRRTDTQGEYPLGTYIDDRDEWEEHRERYGYPEDVVEHLEELTGELEEAVSEQHPPFDDATADVWLDRLAALGLDRPA